jgi:hypothetical protein
MAEEYAKQETIMKQAPSKAIQSLPVPLKWLTFNRLRE